MMQSYNSGNIKKYKTKNPLKRKMVENLNKKIILLTGSIIDNEKVKILDARCGEGYITRLLAESFPEAEVSGLEYTKEALDIAKSYSDINIKYVRGNIEAMPFEDASFDIVICTEVLEHLEHPKTALKELQRVAKKGILITVPHEPWFRLGNMIVLKNITRLGNPIDHINHWTFSRFKQFIKAEAKDAVFYKSFPWSIAIIIKDLKQLVEK